MAEPESTGGRAPQVGGRYELEEIAGRGGMAVVWRGRTRGDLGFARPVAVKQIHDHLASRSIYVDMFAEEARVGAELHDSNIAQTYDFVAEGGRYYLVMEWVDGVDLGAYIQHARARREGPPWELVVAIGIGVLRGLAAAHDRRDSSGRPAPIVHRDVSPHNILVNRKGRAKLIDFGLALARDRSAELTDPGIVKGKMAYLAPEIAQGERPSPASDQFAMGSVLWEALAARKLFDGESDYEVYCKLREARVPPLRAERPDVPARLVRVIHRALSGDASERFASAADMARELGIVLKGSRDPGDLHARLARMVGEVSESDAAREPGEVSTATPAAELAASAGGAGNAGARPGLVHRLSQFLRGR